MEQLEQTILHVYLFFGVLDSIGALFGQSLKFCLVTFHAAWSLGIFFCSGFWQAFEIKACYCKEYSPGINSLPKFEE